MPSPTQHRERPARWAYRARQFLSRVVVWVRPADTTIAGGLLPPAAYELFLTMSRGDQAHALCVLRQLQATSPVDFTLAQAALLHDVGKAGSGLTLAHRVLMVSLGAVDRSWLARLANPRPGTLGHPFYVHLHHPEIGAERTRLAGCAPEVVALVFDHEARSSDENPTASEALAALRHADDRC